MKRSYLTIGALVLSASLIVIGLLLKQNDIVLTKAIKICLECVGIG